MRKFVAMTFFALTTWAMMGAAPARLTPKEKELARCRLMCLDNEAKRAEQCYTLSPSEERRCLEEQRRDSRECEKKCDSVDVNPAWGSGADRPDDKISQCQGVCLEDDRVRAKHCDRLDGAEKRECLDASQKHRQACLDSCQSR